MNVSPIESIGRTEVVDSQTEIVCYWIQYQFGALNLFKKQPKCQCCCGFFGGTYRNSGWVIRCLMVPAFQYFSLKMLMLRIIC